MARHTLSKLFRSWAFQPKNLGKKSFDFPLRVEAVEERLAPATLDPVQIIAPTANTASVALPRIDPPGTGTPFDFINPQVVADPTNALNQVLVATRVSAGTTLAAVFRTTTDGGVTWSGTSALSSVRDPNILAAPNNYANTSSPAVAFGRDGTLYFVYLAHSNDKSSGAVLFSKATFGGAAAAPVVLYRWLNNDRALNPTIAVDNNVQTYTDPVTGQVFTDTMLDPTTLKSKGIYIAWNANSSGDAGDRPTVGGVLQYNPNPIQSVVSGDDGATWTNPQPVSDGGYLTAPTKRGGGPQIIFTPATAGAPGSLVFAWAQQVSGKNFSRLAIESTQPDGGNAADLFVPQAYTVAGTYGAALGKLLDATAGDPNDSTSSKTVNLVVSASDFDDPNFVLNDISVSMAIVAPNVNHLSVVLRAPNNNTITLVRNRTQTDGNAVATPTNQPFAPGLAPPTPAFNPASPPPPNVGLGVFNGFSGNITGQTVFSDTAARRINDPNSNYPYIGAFRPEGAAAFTTSSTPASIMASLGYTAGTTTAANLVGTWQLTVTDFRDDRYTVNSVNYEAPEFIDLFGLTFSSVRNGFGTDALVAGTVMPSIASDFNNAPLTGLPVAAIGGISPSISLAFDTSLGSDSPYAGSIYAAYTSLELNAAGDDAVLSDSNVHLVRGFQGATGTFAFNTPVRVNDDANNDNLTEGNRPQFTPSVAVDQSTGTVVTTWYDTRLDANKTRAATFLATSIDGGATFSKQWYSTGATAQSTTSTGTVPFLNQPKNALDIVTNTTYTLQPIPSNVQQAIPGNQFTSPANRMSVIASGGKIFAYWAGNSNAVGSSIMSARALTAAGPRVAAIDMGPVTQATTVSGFDVNGTPINGIYNTSVAADGTQGIDGFVVDFDRPIDPTQFAGMTPAQLSNIFKVQYLNPYETTPTAIPVGSAGVFFATDPTLNATNPLATAAATRVFVQLLAPQFGIGTYSISVGPQIRDRVRGASTNTYSAFSSTTASYTGVSTTTAAIPVPANVPLGAVIQNVTVAVNLDQGGSSPWTKDLILTLIAPDGTRITLANHDPVGTAPTDSAPDFTNTFFTDAAAVSISNSTPPHTGSFQPNQPLAGLIGRPAAGGTGFWQLEIDNNWSGGNGTLLTWSVNVTLTAPLPPGIGNVMDQDGDANPGEFLNDAFTTPATRNNVPFAPPYISTTLPLIIPGPRVLANNFRVLTSVPAPAAGPNAITVTMNRYFDASTMKTPAGIAGVLDPSAAPIAGPFLVTPLDPVTKAPIITGYTNVFQLTLPVPAVAGTYTVNLAGTVLAADVLSLESPTSSTVVTFDRDMNTDPASGGLGVNNIIRITGPAGTVYDRATAQVTATAAVSGGGVTGVTVVNGGTGYVVPPFVRLTGGGGTGATAVATIINGQVASITVTNPGTGYTSAPTVSVTPLTVTAMSAREFRIGFPAQVLSGTYTVEIDPFVSGATNLGSPARPAYVDTNMNAGLDVLRGGDPTNGTALSSTYTATFTGGAAVIPAAVRGAPAQVDFPITISDAYQILISAAQQIQVRLNVSTLAAENQNVTDLTADLVAPDGTTIRLFANVGNATRPPGTLWFSNTILSDKANTPIQSGFQPFDSGPYNPQFPLSVLDGVQFQGTWKLRITNAGTRTPNLSSWSLVLPRIAPGTGLGETNADRMSVSFKLFNQNPTDDLTQKVWTPVGPASQGAGATSSRTNGLAVDPSDPSGNTVYLGGASGGVWKTTNFLTKNAAGPTWVPLTDSGPTYSLNVVSIAVFPRNNDPQQSIIFALTGEGDTGSPGVGVLRSMDGGRTWVVLDSRNNTDLPVTGGTISSITAATRDRVFFGTSGFKIIVDPKAAADAEKNVIVYLAGSAGVWRSVDTGRHWTQIRSGDATDIVLAEGSASAATGNLQILYAAFRGDGVYMAQPAYVATNMTPMTGTPPGNGSYVDNDAILLPRVPIAGPVKFPSGSKGRIMLATPALTNNPLQDLNYQGWLYALVIAAGDNMDGLYVTKDFGQNWTNIKLSENLITVGGVPVQGFGTNDYTKNDHDTFAAPPGVVGSLPGQGNYDVGFAIDPQNPHVLYIGGTNDSAIASDVKGGLIRVDTTGLMDATAFVAYDNGAVGANEVMFTAGTGNLVIKTSPANSLNPPFNKLGLAQPYGVLATSTVNTGMLNVLRNPTAPFTGTSVLSITNTVRIRNTGFGATWRGFPVEVETDVHRIITMVDQATGLTRVIVGDDQGVSTAVEDGAGNIVTQLGTGSQNLPMPGLVRNGNLQTIQWYSSTAQPSQLAADISALQKMFFGEAQDDGFPSGPIDVLQTGAIEAWNSSPGDGSWGLTDPTGSGSYYDYKWPCCGGNNDEFFQVDGIGRTLFLLQPGDVPKTNTGNWALLGGPKFGVNTSDGNGLMIGSLRTNRLFRSVDKGATWFVVGGDAAAGTTPFSGSPQAVAFGSPDPNNPGQTNNFLYAGTTAGRVYVSFNGGGASWIDITRNVSGGIQQIIPDPVRGSRAVYLVTGSGVFFKADSADTATNWVNITGNLFTITKPIFEEANATPQGGLPAMLRGITSLAVDWRYNIPVNPANPSLGSFPVLYVGGNGGVFRSLNRGATWQVYPQGTTYTTDFVDHETGLAGTTTHTIPAGGYLPSLNVTQLTLSQGNIDPSTGQPLQETGGLNMLTAATYGRGTWVIRLGTPETDPALKAAIQPDLDGNPATLDANYQVVKQSGPQVIGVTVTAQPNPTTTVRIQFDAPVLAKTFELGDIQVTDAAGNPLRVVSVTPIVDPVGPANRPTIPGTPADFRDLFDVVLAPVTGTIAPGRADIVIGPNIADFGGFSMNQDDDFTNGETAPDANNGGAAADAYHGTILLDAAATTGNLFIDMQTSTVAGEPVKVIVTALDPATGLPLTGFVGTVRFTTSDPLLDTPAELAAAGLPATYTFTAADQGTRTFTYHFRTASAPPAPTQFRVDDLSAVPLNAATDSITVFAAAATHFTVTTAVTTLVAGTATDVTVTARDQFENVSPAYAGTVTFTSDDPQAAFPLGATYTFTGAGVGNDNGVHTFTGGAVLKTVGSKSVVATDATNPLVTLTGSTTVTVTPAAATSFLVTGFPAPVVAGSLNDFTVTARDPFGNVDTNYVGQVAFASNDGQAALPLAYTFTGGDAGVHTFVNGAQLKTATNAGSITATDKVTPSITGTLTPIIVTPAATAKIALGGLAGPLTAGKAASFTVTASDTYGNITPAYTGSVSFLTSDAKGSFNPATYTFVAADKGVHTFSPGVTLQVAGPQDVTVNDTGNGFSDTVSLVVTPAAASRLAVTGTLGPVVAGSANDFTVTAYDPFDNVATGYTGTVAFTSNDTKAAFTPATTYTFTGADTGTKTFVGGATLKTATTSAFITATDTKTASITGKLSPIVVTPDKTSQLVFTGFTGSIKAGTPQNYTLTALDQFNNVTPAYDGTVTFGSTDPGATFTNSPYTFVPGTDKGVHVFTSGATLVTAGTQSVSASDAVNGVVGSKTGIVVIPAAASVLTVTGVPGSVVAGTANNFTVTAFDPYGNKATGYTGTVQFTTSDAQGTFAPTSYTFVSGDAGSKTFLGGVTLKTATNAASITATDKVTATITGTQAPIAVTPAATAKILFTGGLVGPIVAGTATPFTLTAQDAFGNVTPAYTGTVAISSSDTKGTFAPAPYTFTTGDAGVHTFTPGATLVTAGTQTVTAKDFANGLADTKTGIVVVPAAPSKFTVTGFPGPVVAGSANDFTVTAFDPFGNRASNYTGTVDITTNDPLATLALGTPYTFTAVDSGSKTFTAGATLRTATATGSITATDSVTPAITGTLSPITVTPAATAKLVVGGLVGPITAGTPSTYTVTAADQFGNTTPNYLGTIAMSSTDAGATFATTPYTFVAFDKGTHTFTAGATLVTAGTQSVTAKDAANFLSNTLSGITVVAGAASTMKVTAPSGLLTAGSATDFTVSVYDKYSNVATTYGGTVKFSSNDPLAAFTPTSYTFTGADNGVHTFSGGAVLKTAGTSTIVSTDFANGLKGTLSTLTVVPGPTSQFVVGGITTVVAGTPATYTLTAADSFGNRTPTYTGTVAFTSTDAKATFSPTSYTFTGADNGVHSFANGVTLVTAGAAKVTATDATNPTISGGKSVTVNPAGLTTISIGGFPSSVVAGVPGTFKVTVSDAFGNVALGYTGTVTFTTNDGQGTFAPTSYTFTAADAGTKTFTDGATLRTVGSRSITVADAARGLTATQSGIAVAAGPAATMSLSGFPVAVLAGTPGTITVTLKDAFGNVATGYPGTLLFSSSDPAAALPGGSNLVNGTGTFTATLNTGGTQFIQVVDSENPALVAVISGIPVTPLAVPPPAVVPPTVPPVIPPKLSGEIVVGSGSTPAQIKLYTPAGQFRDAYTPFGPGFTGGIRTATADFNGDGIADVVAGTGPGAVTQVVVLDGGTGQPIFQIQPFESAFTGGVFVAVGDTTGDGVPDLVVTPDEGGGPRVRVFSGSGFGQLADFLGINDPNFRGGARAAVGDVNKDGFGDVVVAAGFGGGPRVSVHSGKAVAQGVAQTLFSDFFVFPEDADTLRNGAFITVGDIDGDGFADIIAGGGPGGGPRVRAISGQDAMAVGGNSARVVSNFFAGNPNNRGGVRVTVKNLDGDQFADLVVGDGDDAGSTVTAYKGSTLGNASPTPLYGFDAFGIIDGVFVG